MSEPDALSSERPLTEAEYRAWLEKRAPELADELTVRFADVLPEGVRFEWASASALGEHT